MKKVTLYALSILSLAMLTACQPAAPETDQRKPLVSSSKKTSKSSKSSRSSYSKKSTSKKDFSSGFNKDDSYSSSDSNTREDPNYTMSLMESHFRRFVSDRVFHS